MLFSGWIMTKVDSAMETLHHIDRTTASVQAKVTSIDSTLTDHASRLRSVERMTHRGQGVEARQLTPQYIITAPQRSRQDGGTCMILGRDPAGITQRTGGWSDIGYHLGIERVDNAYTVKFGRQLNQMGAHCKADRMNHRSIGICCVGNFDEVKPPPEQWALAAASGSHPARQLQPAGRACAGAWRSRLAQIMPWPAVGHARIPRTAGGDT
jgi:hypothetical protein